MRSDWLGRADLLTKETIIMKGGKQPDIKPTPKAAPVVTQEDESVKNAGDAERRRIAMQASRSNAVTSNRSAAGYKTTLG